MDHDRLVSSLAAFAVLEPTHFPLHFAQIFLVVAQNEPCTFQKVMKALDLTNSAVSRTVMALGQTSRKGTPGFDLMYVAKDPKEGRRLIILLTPKGKALYRQLLSI